MISCFFENNNKASLRHVTVDALVTKDNKILLVKRAPHLISGNKYALPGGFLDRDETTKEAMVREIKEETGYEVTKIELFRVNDDPKRKGEDRQNVDFVYLVEVGQQVSKHDNEVKQLEWFDLASLPNGEEFAFDHYDTIKLYLDYKKDNFNLPLIK